MQINNLLGAKTPVGKLGKAVRAAALSAASLIPTACGDAYLSTRNPVATERVADAVKDTIASKFKDTIVVAENSISNAANDMSKRTSLLAEFIGNIYFNDGNSVVALPISTVKKSANVFTLAPIEGPISGIAVDAPKVNSDAIKKYFIDPYYFTKDENILLTEVANGNKTMTDGSSNSIRDWMSSVMDKNTYVKSGSDYSCFRLTKTPDPSIHSKELFADLVSTSSTGTLTNIVPRDSVNSSFVNGTSSPKERIVFDFCKDSLGNNVDAYGKIIK